MSNTPSGLLAHCRESSSWMYVYGMKGAVLTKEKYDALKKQYGSMVWDTDIEKVGKICCDCSGLISSYTGVLRNSASYNSNAPESATIEQLNENWDKYVGWALYMPGHIGVVSDTKGYYYAMDGSARNWVHYPIGKNNWTKVIKICDIDYSETKKGDFAGMTDLQKELFVKNVMYLGLLDREADEGGLKNWVSKLNDTTSLVDIMNQFMESEEYRQRTVIVAYEKLLGREPEPEGLTSWTNWLKGEKTADDLYNAIKASDEYKIKNS